MAHKKGGGTAQINRDSQSKRLGVKLYGGEVARPGGIIVRQKGNRFFAGVGTKLGNDFTIYAVTSGKVSFRTKLGRKMIDVL